MKRKTLFSPPLNRGSDRKNHQAIVLNIAIWSVIALILISEFGNIFGGATPFPVRIFNYLFLGIVLFYRHLLFQDRLSTLWHILVLGLGIIYITLDIFFLGTISAPTTLAYIIPVTLAGFLFGKKGIYRATFLTSLLIFCLTTLESLNLMTKAYAMPGFTQWLVYTSFLGIISNLLIMSLKITERYWMRAEQEVCRRKEIEKTLHLYSHAIRHSPIAIIIMDAKGIIERVNPKFESMTGYCQNDVTGKNLNYFHTNTHPLTSTKPLWTSLYAGDEWQSEVRSCRKNGQRYWEKISIAPIFNNAGEITHYISISEDITKQKEARLKEREAHQKLREQLEENKKLQIKLKRQALYDSLTGLYNRHYMNEMLDKEFSRAKRSGESISIILIDLDHLKELNDQYGHSTGDQALQVLAAELRAATRNEDAVCRYGGDEFAIILPNTNANDAYTRVVSLHKHIKTLKVLNHQGIPIKIGFSAGIAAYPAHGTNSKELFNYADTALYRAKNKGRNQVELFNVEQSPKSPPIK